MNNEWLNMQADDVAWCHREARDCFAMGGKLNTRTALEYKQMADDWTAESWRTYERSVWGRGAK